jgi:hypothetical protein
MSWRLVLVSGDVAVCGAAFFAVLCVVMLLGMDAWSALSAVCVGFLACVAWVCRCVLVLVSGLGLVAG